MAAKDSAKIVGTAAPPSRRVLVWTTGGYGLLMLGALGALLLIRSHGITLVAPPAVAPHTIAEAPHPGGDVFLHVLIALTAVIVTGLILAKALAYLRQPPVIGEVIAGIVLGPSFLGADASALLLPPTVAPVLGVIAQLGVLLYMFTVGLELHPDLLRHRAHATVAISHTSILVPFVLGALLALVLYPRLSSSHVPFTSFALFLGVAMSITAFPVLARILTDRRLLRTELGALALSCAAIDDVTAWCLLAFVVGVAQAQVGTGLLVAAGTLAYITLMFLLVRPLLRRVVARWDTEPLPRSAVACVFVALLLSALATEYIGIHAIFGAFLLGAIIPHDSLVARTFTRHLDAVVTVVFLPAFFAFTGMRTRIDLVSGMDQWLLCGLIVVVATGGKFGGTVVAARLTGLGWRQAAALGTLMNTRGLMELIVLNIGLDLRVISPTLFAMMVVMALVTTLATAPVLQVLMPSTATEDASGRASSCHG
jgi:Kef-type K+ transport system membrane component KefB